ncbi:CGNR zinc finger domain-containing protein [Streptomyces sp. NPDC002574]|uniref:CGNR zinc finger domain-containing protein n=1 Tax=Streptomyces sp. NPDC002574 TaxID=3364652 RepID=UPI003678BD4C
MHSDSNTARDDARPAISPTATAIVDLLNSRPHGTTPALPEALGTHRAAGIILRPFGHPDTAVPSAERIAEVRSLRDLLMRMVVSRDSEEAAPVRAQLTERAAAVTLRPAFVAPGQVRLRQVDGDPVIGGIFLAVARLMGDGTWPRIRACGNELCTHVFYDTTRSGTRRWHAYESCGNRRNVAAFRARSKARPGD